MKEGNARLPPIGLAKDLFGATLDQRRVHDQIEQGPRGGVPSPFLAMLDSPDLAAAIQEVGVVIRFKGRLLNADRELAILATAGAVGCDYEWLYHAPIAEAAGVEKPLITATRVEDLPTDLDNWSGAIITFCREVAVKHSVADDLLATIIEMVGRDGATELIAIAGYYSLLANFIIIGGHDRPIGAATTNERAS